MGTNNVLRAVQSGEPVSILLVPAIFLGTVLTHLCGGSAGREGAALQMGGSIGWNLGTLLRLKDHDRPHRHHQRHGCVLLCPVRHPAGGGLLCYDGGGCGPDLYRCLCPRLYLCLIAYGCSLVFGIAPTHFALTAPELNVRTALLVILLGRGLRCRFPPVLLHPPLHGAHRAKASPEPWVRVLRAACWSSAFPICSAWGGITRGHERHHRCRGAGTGTAVGFSVQDLPYRADPCLRVQGRRGSAQLFVGATFGCVVGPLLGLPAGFAAAVGLVSIFCGATNA